MIVMIHVWDTENCTDLGSDIMSVHNINDRLDSLPEVSIGLVWC